MQHDQNQQLVLAVLRHAVLKELRDIDSDGRDTLADELAPGTKLTALLNGKPIGTVSKTLPKDKARVDDKYQVMAWASEHAPEMLHYRITDMDAAIKALEEHAPDLLTLDIPDHHMANVKRRAEAGETIPGVELVEGKPTLQIRSEKARALAHDAIQQAIEPTILKEIEQ